MRPTLRPGLRVLRRDHRTLQLGLEWPGVGTLVETPALRAVLEAVDSYRDIHGVVLAAAASGQPLEACEAALALLIERGVLVDQAATLSGETAGSVWSSAWLLAGPGRTAHDVLGERRRCLVQVSGRGLVADRCRALLHDSQVGLTESQMNATALVIAADHEPSRDEADRAMHSGLPHLWVHVRDLVGVVGPFVVPGETACLRCVDAARSEVDPAWPTMLAAHAAQAAQDEPTGPCDSAQASLVAAWAAQELSVWASALRPQSWSRVIEIPLGLGHVDTQVYEAHPKCGCGWPLWHDTMGA